MPLEELLCSIAIPRVITDKLGVEEGAYALEPVDVVVEVVSTDASRSRVDTIDSDVAKTVPHVEVISL